MKEFENINDILDFAIAREQAAVEFYNRLSKEVTNFEMSEVFIDFAKEEMQHKALLLKVKEEGNIAFEKHNVQDIKIADYINKEEVSSEDLNYVQALKLAMWREKAAHELYLKLSTLVEQDNYKELFKHLANEELKHKSRFEKEYDDIVLREN
jgi:rubrerythrin